jgi:hypothetical protein
LTVDGSITSVCAICALEKAASRQLEHVAFARRQLIA